MLAFRGVPAVCFLGVYLKVRYYVYIYICLFPATIFHTSLLDAVHPYVSNSIECISLQVFAIYSSDLYMSLKWPYGKVIPWGNSTYRISAKWWPWPSHHKTYRIPTSRCRQVETNVPQPSMRWLQRMFVCFVSESTINLTTNSAPAMDVFWPNVAPSKLLERCGIVSGSFGISLYSGSFHPNINAAFHHNISAIFLCATCLNDPKKTLC